MKIIVRVRELRKNHNLTQEELARQLNISRQSLISLEQGRWLPSLPLAIQLADFFNAPLEDVIDMPGSVHHLPAAEATTALVQAPHFPFALGVVFPMINVRENTDTISLEAHLPGYTQDQIDIEVADEFVTISGSAVSDSSAEDTYLRQEYYQQSFSRTLGLPEPVVRDEAKATMVNGVLTITLPKLKDDKPKTKKLKPTEA